MLISELIENNDFDGEVTKAAAKVEKEGPGVTVLGKPYLPASLLERVRNTLDGQTT